MLRNENEPISPTYYCTYIIIKRSQAIKLIRFNSDGCDDKERWEPLYFNVSRLT